MAQPPAPLEIYRRAEEEGERRLAMPLLEKTSTGFIAGITVVFGIVAFAMAEELARPRLGSALAHVIGALAFGIGVVFVVVGRSAFTRGLAAGTLLTLLSYLLHAAESTGSRIILAYAVGFFLALGPFDHVVVSGLHLLFGAWLGTAVTYTDVGSNLLLAGAGSLAGGLLLMSLTHTAQVKGARGNGKGYPTCHRNCRWMCRRTSLPLTRALQARHARGQRW
ncbi:formate/nitrite transporter family protein [Streptomyces sp. MAR4 CNY-716]